MMKSLLLLACGATVLAAAPTLAGGPFVVNVTRNTATVVWIVQSDELNLLPPAGGALRTYPSLRVEKTTLTGLTANTKYDYNLPGFNGVKGSFKTAAAATQPYHFVVYGDNRTRNDVHQKVVDQVLKNGVPDFVLQTGDMVENGFDSSLWPDFFKIERDLLRQTVFFPALGNHERDCRNFFDFFQLTNSYYSFNWGNAHFMVFNSDLSNSAPTEMERTAFWAEQTKWMEADLAANQNAEFRFVVAHHPPFTAVARRQNENPHVTALAPMFEKYRVTAALFGHDHNYQHYLKNGVHYIVSGGGGAPLYDVDQPPAGITQKVMSVENFVTVAVDGKTVHMQAIDITGQKIEEFEIKH
jgi:acid phosphatase type 7